MKSILSRTIIRGVCLLAVACATGPRVGGLEPTPEQKAAYRAELEAAWNDFANGNFPAAAQGFRDFQKKHPQTIYETEARLGEARTLEQMGEWSKAMTVENEIIQERLGSHPELAALAMFHRATAAEALGDESQMMASLLDAEKQAAFLPAEIRMAALPARKAVALMKVGQEEDAKKELSKADQGLNQLKAQGLPPAKWAELYNEMGGVATNQLAAENFQGNLDSFANAQIFLLKAIEAGVSPWSDRALQSVESHYRDFWNLAMNPQVAKGLDTGARERMKHELQSRWLGQIGRLIAILRQNQKPDALTPSTQEQALRDFLAKMESEIDSRLMSSGPAMPLTPEAQRRQKLKRDGTVRSEAIFPNEKTVKPAPPPAAKPVTAPVAKPPVEDPNLQSEEKKQ